MSKTSEEKRLYDIEYRRKNKEKIRKRKRKYYIENKSSISKKQKERRQSLEHKRRHAEYCRQPDYKKWKGRYDKVYRAQKESGDFWESHILIVEILKLVKKISPSKKSRLYYKRNVLKIIERNNDKRLSKALNDRDNGKSYKEILSRAWTDENRSILQMLLLPDDVVID